LTAYSRVLINKPVALGKTIVWQSNSIIRWNLMLASGLLLMFLTYIFLSNYLVSQRYSGTLLHRELNKANINLELQGSSKEGQISLDSLYFYAKKNGMVEAKDVESIFASTNESMGFALTGNGN